MATAVILIGWTSFSAQSTWSISGRITDKNTGEPLAGVAVILNDSAQVCSTDSTGCYSITNISHAHLHIDFTSIGYKTANYNLELSGPMQLAVELEPDMLYKSQVEITANRSYSRSTQIATTISERDLEDNRGKNLASTLKTLSGVYSLNTGGGIAKPVIHGLHSNRVITLNNGIRQEGQQWGNEHGPEIDPFIADHLTVIKGSSTLQYGSDALGGVILVEPAALRSTPGIAGDSHMIFNSNGRGGIVSTSIDFCNKNIPALSGRAQGSFRRSGNVNSPEYVLANTGQKEYNFSLSGGYKQGKVSAQIYYSQYNSQVGIFAGSHIGNLSDLEQVIRQGNPPDTSKFTYALGRPYQQIEHELFKTQLNWIIDDSSNIHFTYGRQFNKRQEYDKHVPLNDSLAALNRPSTELELTTHTGDIYLEKYLTGSWVLATGLSGMHQANTYAGMFFIPNYYANSLGGFANVRKKTASYSFETSLRYDIKELRAYFYENNVLMKPVVTFNNWAFSSALNLNLNNKNSITWQIGRAWRAPHASELYSNGLHHGTASIEIGNKNLKEEISYQLSAQYDFSGQSFSISCSPFIYYMQEFIFLQPDLIPVLTIRGAFPSFHYTQSDIWMRGLDLNTQLNLPRGAQLHFQSSLLRSIEKNTGNTVILTPADRYRIKYHQQIIQEFTLTTETVYTAKQWRISNDRDYAPVPEDYFIFNVELSYRPHSLHGQWTFSGSVQNLFNTAYRDYLNRLRYFTLEEGRNFALHIAYSFHKNTA